MASPRSLARRSGLAIQALAAQHRGPVQRHRSGRTPARAEKRPCDGPDRVGVTAGANGSSNRSHEVPARSCPLRAPASERSPTEPSETRESPIRCLRGSRRADDRMPRLSVVPTTNAAPSGQPPAPDELPRRSPTARLNQERRESYRRSLRPRWRWHPAIDVGVGELGGRACVGGDLVGPFGKESAAGPMRIRPPLGALSGVLRMRAFADSPQRRSRAEDQAGLTSHVFRTAGKPGDEAFLDSLRSAVSRCERRQQSESHLSVVGPLAGLPSVATPPPVMRSSAAGSSGPRNSCGAPSASPAADASTTPAERSAITGSVGVMREPERQTRASHGYARATTCLSPAGRGAPRVRRNSAGRDGTNV